MQPLVLFLQLLFIGLTSADFLQNPDFESPPTNLAANHSNPFMLLNGNNTIPGWSFEGTVQYVTASQSIQLPDDGHAIQLGQDGKINQTFVANGDNMNYILTFTLAPGGQNCLANADVAVSAPDSHGVFSLKQHYGKETWESYGHYLDNLLLNGGFEVGPDLLSNLTEGILLEPAPSPVQSALPQWSVIGTVKYIDSMHFFFPKGNAAIEIVSVLAGIQTAIILTESSVYNLDFTLGDANDACEGSFVVRVQAGAVVQNFTVQSIGRGSAIKHSVTFKAGSGPTPISFLSYSTNQTKDGVFCGPVIDDVIMLPSRGLKLELRLEILIYALVLVAIL